MKSLPVGELKAKFSEVLEEVQKGETIEIVYGKKKKPIARIVPINGTKQMKKRKLGIWEGKVKYVFGDNFKMTDEELLDLRRPSFSIHTSSFGHLPNHKTSAATRSS